MDGGGWVSPLQKIGRQKKILYMIELFKCFELAFLQMIYLLTHPYFLRFISQYCLPALLSCLVY